jgi:dihydroorotate dehydrogenase
LGNFSGKPTFKRSNELIELAYKNYGKKLVVVGCGGVFSGQDAYRKIRLGASLVQMITGLVYEGPGVVAKINIELADLLEKDGFESVSQAIGKDVVE